MTTELHHPDWQQSHWQQPHWRVSTDMPPAGDRRSKMAIIVGINSVLWVAMLAAAWFAIHG